jgi:DUF2975 family protein
MSDSALRKQARILKWLVTIPFAALALLAMVLVGNIAWQAEARGGEYATGIASGVVIYYLPMAFYMWAIWMIRRALKSIAAGELFNRVVPKLLARVGLALFGGAVFTEFGVPLLTGLLSGRPYVRTFEPSAVTLGVVGISLVLFAELLRRAAAMREELGEFL